MAKNKDFKIIIPHLYVHFPFCRSKCLYCSFYSIKYSKIQFAQYLKAINNELNYYKNIYNLNQITTLYFGGGTPSLIPNNLMSLYNNISSSITLDSVKEVTVECNPYDISEELVDTLKIMKSSRVSIGIQSFNQIILSDYNRAGLEFIELVKRIELLKDFNLNIDLINGFYHTDINIELAYLNRLLDKFKNIQHISFYDLSLPQNINKDLKILNEDKISKYEKEFINLISNHGFVRYEVANYCKDSNKSLHNLGYWKYSNYLGLGPSAHSTINNIRMENDKNIHKYNNGKMNYKKIIKLTKKEQIEEYLLMGLRLTDGININEFEKRFNFNFDKIFSKTFIEKHLTNKTISYEDNHLKMTEKGMNILNKLLLEMFIILDKIDF